MDEPNIEAEEESRAMSSLHGAILNTAVSTEIWGDPFYVPFKRLKYGCAGQGLGSS